MTTVRPGGLDDAAGYLDLLRQILPWQVSTVDAMRHRWQATPPASRSALFAIDDGTGLAGLASCGLNTWSSEPGAATVRVVVRPDRRGQGVGTALLAAAEEHLSGVGARRVLATAFDDPHTINWVRRHGYETKAQLRYSGAPLAGLPPMPPVPPDVTMVDFDRSGPEPVFALVTEALRDEPGEVSTDDVDYDVWVRQAWPNPALRRDLSIVAFVDDVPASCTFVHADPDSGRIWSSGTGTSADHRGRGLAKLTKSVALRRARDAGLSEAFTCNDEVNGPMLAVNEWLGYRPVGAEWECLKTLATG